jgi:hypothetical protein
MLEPSCRYVNPDTKIYMAEKKHLTVCRHETVNICAESTDVQTCILVVPLFFKVYITVPILKRICFRNCILI